MSAAVIGLACILGLAMLGVPIAFAMMLVGFVGFAVITDWYPAMAMVGQLAYDTSLTYSLAVLPLFILMGNFITRAGLSDDLYRAAYAFVGHLRGGLALSTLISCGGFSAVSGSSLATAATISKVAMPSMRRFGYADTLATGSIAAGGTLGILIPPSVVLVLYGIMTNNDIGQLFIAGILPGLVGLLLYCLTVQAITLANPEAGPPGECTGWRERLAVLRRTWGILALFALVIGGIYGGLFTPTEAAGVGAASALLLALARGGLSLRAVVGILLESARTTAMIFAVLIGAFMFANFINVAGLMRDLQAVIAALDIGPFAVLAGILVCYLLLGMVLESMSMLLLTIPIFYPLAIAAGFDPIWFGIVVVVVIEISLITPPIGMNVFILRATLSDVATTTVFRGVLPFVGADILRLLLLLTAPWLVLT
ncbi:TRAP transporter large permease [Algihabitans albus]|uniref:TRAP transporter large permease n=1 Tax=Algihabitans albus TaxID=2164067 RepID=UPI000E5CFE58|nr:TRAP transporter large permease [Algihabitans albus]